MTAENAAEATIIGRHQACDMNTPTPPATKPIAANTNKILARVLVTSLPKKLANAQEPSGQIIPD